jgi:diguanylate cyclase (GGDEF)-like protein
MARMIDRALEPVEAREPTGPDLLVADDDLTILHTTAWLLKAAGYAVRTAHGGEALLQRLEEQPPSLVVLDASLPGSDVYETLARLKADPRWGDLPVLMLAALPPDEAAPMTIGLGAADFVRKPIRVRELLARIQAQLRTQEALARTRVALRTIEDELRRARDENARLEVLAHTDPLTQLLNRRALMQRLAAELDRARRYDSVVTLLLIDLDYFKDVNDTHGHRAGDATLREIAGLLSRAVRSVDVVARYGGEEFVIVLPETTEIGAVAFAERIRERIEQQWFAMDMPADTGDGAISPVADGREFRVTASIGVASFPAPLVDSVEDFFARADAALYRAKLDGRNRVRT